MFNELIGVVYLGAIVACFVGASVKPRYRGPLLALGAVLVVPVIFFFAIAVYFLIALSSGAHLF